MKRTRRVFGGEFRAKVALAAVREDQTLSQLALHFKVHANQVSAWRKELLDRAAELFEDGRKRKAAAEEQESVEELYAQIGRLQMQVEWLKKKSAQLP
jgi:transposase-like protein